MGEMRVIIGRRSETLPVRMPPRNEAAAVIRDLMLLPKPRLDYTQAKLALDAIIDPSTDAAAIGAELEGLAETAREMAGAEAGPRRS